MIEYTEQAHMVDFLRMCGEGTFANCARCGADNIFCHGIMRQRMLAAADMIERMYKELTELRDEELYCTNCGAKMRREPQRE